MKKIIIAAGVIAIVLLAAFAISRPRDQTETIKIGAVLPTSGSQSQLGENIRRGALIAIDEVNDRGGLLGKKLELVVEDNRSVATSSDEAAANLARKGVEFLIVGSAEDTQEVIPVVTENKIITMTVAATTPRLTESSPYLYRTVPSDSIAINTLTGHAKGQGLKRAAIVYTETDWGEGLAREFESYAKKADIAVIKKIAVAEKTKNFAAAIEALQAAKPDHLYIPIRAGDIEIFIKSARQSGLQMAMFYPNDLTIVAFTGEVPVELLPGVYFVIYEPASQAFAKAYNAAYKVGPGVASDTSYDAVMAIAKAIAKSKSTDPDKVKNSFESFDGASGTVSFNQNRERPTATVGLMTWNGTSPTPEWVK